MLKVQLPENEQEGLRTISKKERAEGLSHRYSSGKTNIRNTKLKPLLEIWLKEYSCKYGFKQSLWGIDLIIAAFKKETGHSISRDSVENALKENVYSYKKPKKQFHCMLHQKKKTGSFSF
jgi:transposase